MLLMQIAGTIVAVGVGVWLGFRLVGICIDWLKYGLGQLKPPKKKKKH